MLEERSGNVIHHILYLFGLKQVQGVKYFKARPNHGLFVRASKVEKIKD